MSDHREVSSLEGPQQPSRSPKTHNSYQFVFLTYDEIEPVSKGVKGADVVHRVRTNAGQECGTIVWEAKRCKAWSGNWTGKLKEDQRTLKASTSFH
jgi:hypothetical protein